MASTRTLRTSTSSITADGTITTSNSWSSAAFGVTGKNAMSGHWMGKTFIPHTSTTTGSKAQGSKAQGAKSKVVQSSDTLDPNTASSVTGKKSMSQIKNNLLRPALTSHYGVEIGVPDALRGMLTGAGGQQSQLNLLCSEVVLPGSNLATMQINNNFTGVTERHAYRRVFDDRINLTFYVDSQNYLPIRFFEAWKTYIMNEDGNSEYSSSHNYRVRYPDEPGSGYTASGLTITKFERDYMNTLRYEFIKSYPISVSAMPVSYDTSGLLKCTVSMTYLRYIVAQTRPFMSAEEYKGRGFFTKDQLLSGGMTSAQADKFIFDQNTATPGRLGGNFNIGPDDGSWGPNPYK